MAVVKNSKTKIKKNSWVAKYRFMPVVKFSSTRRFLSFKKKIIFYPIDEFYFITQWKMDKTLYKISSYLN